MGTSDPNHGNLNHPENITVKNFNDLVLEKGGPEHVKVRKQNNAITA